MEELTDLPSAPPQALEGILAPYLPLSPTPPRREAEGTCLRVGARAHRSPQRKLSFLECGLGCVQRTTCTGCLQEGTAVAGKA